MERAHATRATAAEPCRVAHPSAATAMDGTTDRDGRNRHVGLCCCSVSGTTNHSWCHRSPYPCHLHSWTGLCAMAGLPVVVHSQSRSVHGKYLHTAVCLCAEQNPHIFTKDAATTQQ